jgi:hypothetical protein
VQEGEEVGDDAFHLVGNKHLVAVELDLVALQLDAVVHTGEVKYTCEMEGEVDVEVNPEQRFFLHGIKRAVEILVVFIFQSRRGLGPQRFHGINDVVLVGLHLLAILPLCLLTEGHGHSHELTVFVEQRLDTSLIQKFFTIVRDMQDDV